MSLFRKLVLSAAVLAAFPAFGNTPALDPGYGAASQTWNSSKNVVGALPTSAAFPQGGGAARSGGLDLGASFAGGVLAFLNGDAKSHGQPLPLSGPATLGADSSATLNFAAGVTDGLSLDIDAGADAQGLLTVFGGLDRTGKVLGTVDLSAHAQLDGWQHLVLPFVGIAQSIGLDVSAGTVTYDHVAVSAVSAVPEPGTYVLLVCGLAGVAAVTYRRRRD